MPADQDASKATIQPPKSYHGYGCAIVSTGQRSRCRGVHREQASARETAMRVTCDALAVEKPIWMLGDAPTTRSAGTTTCWPQVVPVAPYNARNTDDPKDIEYRVGPASTNTARRSAEAIDAGRDVQPPEWSRTNQRRRQGLRPRARSRPRPRPRITSTSVLALCLRLVIAITNDERGTIRKHRHHAMRTILRHPRRLGCLLEGHSNGRSVSLVVLTPRSSRPGHCSGRSRIALLRRRSIRPSSIAVSIYLSVWALLSR